MKGLEGMIRLAKWRVDEARKPLQEVDQRLHEIDREAAALARALEDEQAAAADVPGAAAYAAFAGHAVARQRALAERRKEIETERERRQAALAEAFQAQKKYQIVAERRAAEAAEAEKKREQAELDEVGLQRHAQAGDGDPA